MSALQLYVYLSTIMFILLTIMLSGESAIGLFLKGIAAVMSVFGVIVGMAVSGFVLSNGIRLV